LPSGMKVNVRGAEMVGGRVSVRYLPDGPEVVAADAGDYVYPSDVRMSQQGTSLLVKADGLAGGIHQETWLFEYSLERRRLITKSRIDPDVLPAECELQEPGVR